MRYIGIDLAWGEKNTTAAVALEGTPGDGVELVAAADALTDDASVLAFVDAWDDEAGLLVAIDAPTLVPNETGRRPCEAVISACLRRHEAGAHPSNRSRLSAPDGTIRGERLVAALAERGIAHTPYLAARPAPVRAAFEVFPHPAHVALFGLEKTLKYKAKPQRGLEGRLSEFRRYASLLAALSEGDPALRLPTDGGPLAFAAREPGVFATGTALKRHEDLLDALTCAYVALYRHRWGDERCPVVGDLTHGYIVTPRRGKCSAAWPPAHSRVSRLGRKNRIHFVTCAGTRRPRMQ
jgi:predicted RNase H-like nuclease